MVNIGRFYFSSGDRETHANIGSLPNISGGLAYMRILRLEFVKNLRIILRIFEAQIRDDSLAKTNKLSKRYSNPFKKL